MKTLHWRNLTALCAAGLLLGACAAPGTPADDPDRLPGETAIPDLQPVDLSDGERLRVVATTSIAAEVVRSVAGDEVDLAPLLPFGADPHTYEPTPQDVRALAQAHVVFVNGLGLEPFLAGALESAGGRAVVISLSEGIEPLALGSDEGQADAAEGEQHAVESEDGHHHGGVDPHVWLDPLNVARWAENAAAALAALDPARADHYRGNADAYTAVLRGLDVWIRGQVAQISEADRKLVTDHDELGYFANRYGFEIVGALIPAYSSAAEPSAQELSQLETTIRELGTRAVFVGTGVNQELAARVAEDTGVRLVPLYTHSLSGPEGPATSYRTLMEYNVNAIVEALR
jgi:ABC-type Zn uptake system ZnuABC Zn-binding protein ZnuA